MIMPFKKGDEPATWNLARTEIPYQEGDITEEEYLAWRNANAPDWDEE
jgi:hypothetical protein